MEWKCFGVESESKQKVRDAKNAAWVRYLAPIKAELLEVCALINEVAAESSNADFIKKIKTDLGSLTEPIRKDIHSAIKKVLRLTRTENITSKQKLNEWLSIAKIDNYDRYSSYLFSQSDKAVLNIKPADVTYGDNSQLDGREVLRENFDAILGKFPEVMIFGEDSGKIGGVNQGLEGLQKKYGEHRVFDTGIREATIMGQAIGLALRGFRPIAEIQYLDYLLYGLQPLS